MQEQPDISVLWDNGKKFRAGLRFVKAAQAHHGKNHPCFLPPWEANILKYTNWIFKSLRLITL